MRDRQRQSDDERVVQVALTPEGVEQVLSWRQRYRDTMAHLLAPLTPEERDQLRHLIEEMLAAANAVEAGQSAE